MKRLAIVALALTVAVVSFRIAASIAPCGDAPDTRLEALREVELDRLAALARARFLEQEEALAMREEEEEPAPRTDDAETAALRAAVAEVSDCYRRARRDEASQKIAAHPQILDWEEAASAGVAVAATYRTRGHGADMELCVTRVGAALGEPLAVAFGPGTYGTTKAKVQELVFLRAPVVVLASDERRAAVRIPIACGSFHLHAPSHDMAYDLRRLEPESPIDRLMVALCAGTGLPSEPEAQLAVWITRNGITRSQFLRQGPVVTFDSLERVKTSHAAGAARLMRGAGLTTDSMPFFQREESRPQRVPTERPADEPEPTLTPADVS